jgi:tetratricopeptide (TPR) repeat protein
MRRGSGGRRPTVLSESCVMYRLILVVIFLSLLIVPGSAQTKSNLESPPPNPYREADERFTFGEEPERDKQSLALIDQALANGKDRYQWLWRRARACYFVGDNAPNAQKMPYFEKGIDAGQQAIALEPNAVEGHFWLAVNYRGVSELKGGLKALSTVKTIRSEMEIVLRLNDRYHDGGAYLALGEIDRQMPKFIGGNLDRAITRLEQGERVAPENLEMKFALAQAYQRAGRKQDAQRELQAITERNPKNDVERRIQEKAVQLLAKL